MKDYDLAAFKREGTNGLDDVEYRIIYHNYNEQIKINAITKMYEAHLACIAYGNYITENHRVEIRMFLASRDDDFPIEFDSITLEDLLKPIIKEGEEKWI